MTKRAEKYADLDLKPPQAVADAAKKGLELREQHGRGGTEVGVKRAEGLSKRDALTPEDVKSIYSYFARHEVDKDAPGFKDNDEPSAGYIAWQLWGGDAGQQWINRLHEQIEKADEGD